MPLAAQTGVGVQIHECGRVWPGERTVPTRLACQRHQGHAGAHVAEVDAGEELRRYWWVPHTGERGVNRYRSQAEEWLPLTG